MLAQVLKLGRPLHVAQLGTEKLGAVLRGGRRERDGHGQTHESAEPEDAQADQE